MRLVFRLIALGAFSFCASLTFGIGQAQAAFDAEIVLNEGPSTPAGGSSAFPTPVTPGQTLSFTTTYTAKGTSGGNKVITFALIDIDTTMYDPLSISVAGSATPVTQINDGRNGSNAPGPADTAASADTEDYRNPYNNCPKTDPFGSPPPAYAFSCDPDLTDLVPGAGKSIYWERPAPGDTNATNPHSVTYRFSFRIREGIAGTHKVCVRTYVAVGNVYSGTQDRSPDILCYEVTSVPISGTVISSPEFATGEGCRCPLCWPHL